MSSPGGSHPVSAQAGAEFRTTHWSVVRDAGRRSGPQSDEALAKLCSAYWYPLYAFVRRRGHSREDAEDLTQEFFARLLAREFFAHLRPENGRFRSFLLASLKNFLANEWDRSQAQKRGGGAHTISFDAVDAETRYQIEPAHDVTPEYLFERRWALTLLESVLSRLRTEFASAGKAAVFDELKVFLFAAKGPSSHTEAATRLGTTEGAVRVAVHRLRQRYRHLLREAIAETVSTPEEIDEEIRHLLSVIGG